ncbi:DNA repair protein RAD16 [Rhodotorula kratochvilovae]
MPPKQNRPDKGKGRAQEDPARAPKVQPVNPRKLAVDSSQLLPFQRSVLRQLVPPENAPPTTGDALLIMARGLGLRTVITTFLKIYDMPEKLVLVVNATADEERSFAEEVGMRLKVIGYEVTDDKRERMYKDGGLFSVTSRILIVDMLKGRIPTSLITGMVVLHAEEVKPTSQEAFVVRLYRDNNKVGFLKAFSDRPETFSFGFAPLQTTLMQLKLRDVVILPRFHDEVDADLQKRKADVVEIYQPLTRNMLDIQTAILECMELTLSEIKRSNHFLEIEDLTVENALFSTFDRLVRTQLDPVWHKVGPKMRGLVRDLTELRKLQDYLLTFDCVRFNQYLETLLSSYSPSVSGSLDRRERPAWLGTPAADTIFTVARNRVYLQNRVEAPAAPGRARETTVDGLEVPDDLALEDWMGLGGDGPTDEEEQMLRELEETARRERGEMPPPPPPPQGGAAGDKPEKKRRVKWMPPGVEPVLEEQPKWAVLSQVLQEIELQMVAADHYPFGSTDTILVMCNSTSACLTLGNYLSSSDGPDGGDGTGQNMLESKLQSYFYWKAHMGKMQKSLKRTPDFSRGERRSTSASSSSSAAGPSYAGGKRPAEDASSEFSAALRNKEQRRGQAPSTKRRRVRGGGAVGAGGGAARAGGAPMFAAATGANPEAFEEDVRKIADMVDSSGAPSSVEAELLDEDEAFNELAFEEYFGLIANEDLVIIRPYLGDEDDRVLDELRPKYVVMFDPTPAFVRRIETYRAAHPGLAIRVYFLAYKDSVEEQKYLSEIRREKDAFVRLIQEKGSMAIPHEAEYRPQEDDGELLRTVSSSRIGGGKQATQEPPRVIVDMREFRSSLPSLLHAARFDVVPVTLGIGDYIITPDMAVERKSIPDLISSFNSGRLFQQAEMLTAHYKEPILLIEFDEKKSFNLETYVDTKTKSENAQDADLRSKLVLLTLAFPKLRLIWSSSPFQTVEIFRDLKESRAEPDAQTAMLVGAEDGEAPAEGENAAANPTPLEVLRQLPGVSSKNYRYLAGQVENLEALVALELGELQALVGVEPAKQLHGFMHTDLHFA